MKIRKWYLDCVADDGATWIGYWGWVEYGPLRFYFASSILNGVATSVSHRLPEPRIDGRAVSWDATALNVRVEMSARNPRLRKELHPAVTWECVAPAADVMLRIGDATIRGRGYADLLEMSVAPWELPVRELRWGRVIGARASLVWIQWSGSHPLEVVLRDGILQPPEQLRFAPYDSTVLRDSLLGESLAALPLAWLFPKRFTNAREQKWRSRATLRSSDGSTDDGWVIHELVTFASP